ncbi:MAG: homocysteine S-methyltransferase family protein [Lachnospiraceae bacterium]|nr:homocysteine S-methyltransferase family protein [Lachnospiraceae bacterium]
MTKEEWKQLIERGPVLLDGATGSNLMASGMPRGVCTETWILDHREVLIGLQRAYQEAGSQIIYAPTFAANRIGLAAHGLENRVEEYNQRLVEVSKEAVGGKALIAGDLTTTGRQIGAGITYEELLDVYKEQIICLANAGVDLLVAETMISIDETMAALDAAHEVCDLPVMCSLTVSADGSAFFGGNAVEAMESLQAMGADAVGLNCSVGPDQIEAVVRCMKQVAEVPVLVKPNAGMPLIDEKGNAVYTMREEAFADAMERLIAEGAWVIGGCCGTTPDYIRALARKIKKR